MCALLSLYIYVSSLHMCPLLVLKICCMSCIYMCSLSIYVSSCRSSVRASLDVLYTYLIYRLTEAGALAHPASLFLCFPFFFAVLYSDNIPSFDAPHLQRDAEGERKAEEGESEAGELAAGGGGSGRGGGGGGDRAGVWARHKQQRDRIQQELASEIQKICMLSLLSYTCVCIYMYCT